jgi:hypothetical protein
MKFVPVLALVCELGCWAFEGCLPVEGGRIRARDFASVAPDFSKLDPALDLGPAPLVGARREFGTQEIERIARRWDVALAVAPPRACFERVQKTLEPESLRPILEGALVERNPRIEILDYSKYPLPKGTPEFSAAGLAASGSWHGRWIDEDGRTTPIWVRVRAVNRSTGEPLVAASDARAIERGDRVQVEVWSGGVLLEFEASAQTAGRVGEAILVKNSLNGRMFRAKVESKGKVVVQK